MGHIDTRCQADVSEYFILFDPHFEHPREVGDLDTFLRGSQVCPHVKQRHNVS